MTNFKSKVLLWITARQICLLNLIPLFTQALELTELPMTNKCLISQIESLHSQPGREKRKKERKKINTREIQICLSYQPRNLLTLRSLLLYEKKKKKNKPTPGLCFQTHADRNTAAHGTPGHFSPFISHCCLPRQVGMLLSVSLHSTLTPLLMHSFLHTAGLFLSRSTVLTRCEVLWVVCISLEGHGSRQLWGNTQTTSHLPS